MRYAIFAGLIGLAGACSGIPSAAAQDSGKSGAGFPASEQRPVVYVMPNALSGPASADQSQVVVNSEKLKEPQVAKIYEELQHDKECQPFAENIIKDKADYYLLLEHGGGIGNRWAVSDKSGNVIASGQSVKLANSVKDACMAMIKNWHENHGSPGK